uniref:Immunoglobulin V-set domain-containing protein n=1 Tax=Cyprinus carpio TaxID=7962 RepID=A0A8C1RMN2_CYPCA
MVLQVQKGHTKYGSGFTERASVSLHHYKDGDLSLNILGVTTSDKGLYRCYHNTDEEHGYPSAVSLIVTGNNTTCSLDYNNRVSVMNHSLVLRGLTSSDGGTFTVKDNMGEVISINTVTVEGNTCISILLLILIASIVLVC